MEAKVTLYRTLQIYPSDNTEGERTAEIIFIEDVLRLKNEGDVILLVRKNSDGLSSLAYLESKSIEDYEKTNFRNL